MGTGSVAAQEGSEGIRHLKKTLAPCISLRCIREAPTFVAFSFERYTRRFCELTFRWPARAHKNEHGKNEGRADGQKKEAFYPHGALSTKRLPLLVGPQGADWGRGGPAHQQRSGQSQSKKVVPRVGETAISDVSERFA